MLQHLPLNISCISHKQAYKLMRHSLIALSTTLCSMLYQMSNWCCFSSLTFWTHATGRHAIGWCHSWVNVGAASFDDINWCYLLQKPESVTGCVCESAVLLKDKKLFWQLTSGTHICNLVCRLKEDNLSKLCDIVNKWLNLCEAFNMARLCRYFCIMCAIFRRLHFTR